MSQYDCLADWLEWHSSYGLPKPAETTEPADVPETDTGEAADGNENN